MTHKVRLPDSEDPIFKFDHEETGNEPVWKAGKCPSCLEGWMMTDGRDAWCEDCEYMEPY